MPKSFFNIAVLCMFAVLALGVDGCTEPKEYCKIYNSQDDRADCTAFCKNHKDFQSSPQKDALILACEKGQMGFLANLRVSAAESQLSCDRYFQDRAQAAACRAGVTAEELRVAKSRSGAGTSADRETGNNR